MTNFKAIVKNNPQFVKEVLAHEILKSDLEKAIKDSRKTYAWYNNKHTADKEGLIFLNEEYIPPVLDAIEKEYLGNLIRPFRDKVTGIKKSYDGVSCYICIYVGYDFITLPNFKEKSGMYKGMIPRKLYTLNELEL